MGLGFGKRLSRRARLDLSRQATLSRARTQSSKELVAVRQAMLHGAEPWLTFSSINRAMGGAPSERRVNDIPRAHRFVPSFEPPLPRLLCASVG